MFARHLAVDAPQGALELAHAGFARVAAHDGLQHAATEPDVVAAQPRIARHSRQQVPARDRQLLVQRVAGEVDHLEPVVERRRDAVDVVRGGDEEHAAEVVLALEVVVAEAVVVRRIEHLHQRRRRVAAPVAVELVELVEQHHGVVYAGLGETLDDAARHRPDVGTAVPADLGLVAHAAESDAHERSPERVGDALRDAALAGAGRAGEAEDRRRLVGGAVPATGGDDVVARRGHAGGRARTAGAAAVRQHAGTSARRGFTAHAADRQILEDAVLDVLEAVVRALQVPVDCRDVDVGRGQLAPRQVEDRVEQAADHGDLGTHRAAPAGAS